MASTSPEPEQSHYGNRTRSTYPVAAWLWGHRMRIGQHWIEYLLEFLNVLTGFEYALGQGVSTDAEGRASYKVHKRLGLRRFVFYDEHEKTLHPKDTAARDALRTALEQKVAGEEAESLILLRKLLRSLSAVEASRSWFAKSLFPAHEALLFGEAARKGATNRHSELRTGVATAEASELDDGIEFGLHNFFARGGELYYLILSAGTEGDEALRKRIGDGFQQLLQQQNTAIGRVAETVEQTWQDLKRNGGGAAPADGQAEGDAVYLQVGWIPERNHPFYRTIAEDIAHLLEAKVEPFERLDLLAHVICFHLALYIYTHASQTTTPPAILVDALEESGPIRQVSAALFRLREAEIEQRVRSYVADELAAFDWNREDAESARTEDYLWELHEHAQSRFVGRLGKRKRAALEKRLEVLEDSVGKEDLSQEECLERYVIVLLETAVLDEFRKNFLGVHRKLTKDTGFVAPKTGRSARFVFSDTLLKALTLAVLGESEQGEVTYAEFLRDLYKRYGLNVGPVEARASGIFDAHRINAEYYDRNRATLLDRLKKAGFASEFSDATALVSARTASLTHV
jgi:hypothetical protein